MGVLFGLGVILNHLEGTLELSGIEEARCIWQLLDESFLPVVLQHEFPKASIFIDVFALDLELCVSTATCLGSFGPGAPLFQRSHDSVWWFGFDEVFCWYALMFEPACDIRPRFIELVLLRFANNFGRSSYVLLLNQTLFHHMVSLHLHCWFLRHLHHLYCINVLSLTPFWESCSTIPLPEHDSKLCNTWVLASCHVFISWVLTNILETTLP